MARWTLVVNGHVVAELDDITSTIYPATETPRAQADCRVLAVARWHEIVDLMLAGQRETGSGKVIPA